MALSQAQLVLRQRIVPVEALVAQRALAAGALATRQLEAHARHLKVANVLGAALFAFFGEAVAV